MTGRALYGRDEELAYIRRAIDGLRRLNGFLAIVEGPPGIGKTTLIDEALDDVPVSILRVSPMAFDAERPFGALLDALGDAKVGKGVLQEIKALVAPSRPDRGDVVRAMSSDDIPLRLTDLFIELLTRAAEIAPLLLVVDDAQWLDTRTAKLLGRLGRVAAAYPLGVLVAMRPIPRSQELGAAIESLTRRDAAFLRLRGLTPDEAVRLAEDVVGAPLGPSLARDVRAARENPLLVAELVKALMADGMLDVESGFADTIDRTLPPTLRVTLLRRLSVFSGPTLDLLRWCAVLGEEFYVKDLIEVAETAPVLVTPALDEALVSQILVTHGDKLAFAHDLIRETLYEDTAPPLRMHMHRQSGISFAKAGAFSKAAPHLAAGVAPGDDEGARLLKVAAERLAAAGPEVAAVLLRRYLDVTEPSSLVSQEIHVRLVGLQVAAGHLHEAEEEARAALEWAQGDRRALLLSDFIASLVFQGRVQEASALPERLGVNEDDLPLDAAAQVAFARSYFDLEGARARASSVLTRNRKGDPVAETFARIAMSSLMLGEGRVNDALLEARLALAAARSDVTGKARRIDPQLTLLSALVMMDTPPDIAGEFRQAARAQNTYLGPLNEPSLHGLAAAWSFEMGEWDDAIAHAEVALGRAEESDYRLEPAALAAAILTTMHARRGDVAAAVALLDSWRDPEGETYLLSWARAVVLFEQGRVAEAAEVAATTYEQDMKRGLLGPLLIYALDFALILDCANHELVHRVPEATSLLASRAGTRWTSALNQACTGLACRQVGGVLEAARVFEEINRPLLAAMSYEAAARLMSSTERQKRDVSERALKLYDQLGANNDVFRMSNQVGKRAPRVARAVAGWDSLTRSERLVLEKVCSGLSNGDIAEALVVSRRTVETHVAHIFQKLQVRGRPELIAKAARERPEIFNARPLDPPLQS